MSQIIGSFRIGEDINVAFGTVDIDPTTVTILDVAMKPAIAAINGQTIQAQAAPIPMSWAPLDSQGTFPAGWMFTLAAAESESLSEGHYMVDAKFQIGSGIEITGRSALINVTRSAVS